jgi:cytochrome c oxidase subunit 2
MIRWKQVCQWCVGLAMGAVLPMVGFAEWTLNMTKGVTPVSDSIYHLHMLIFYICVAIAIIVFGVMAYALFFHRKSRGAVAATFHEHPVLEVLWAVIPFVILVVMAIPATRVLVGMEDTSDADITIKVTGYQWKWKYDYLDEGISFFSNLATPYDQIHNEKRKSEWYLLEVDNQVVLPINRKVRFLVTSNDVIHSWWVPALGIKRDAMPGFIHESWAEIQKPGIYRGQCAELCGINHGYMPIVVKAVTNAEYKKWVATKRKPDTSAAATVDLNKEYTRDELMSMGKETYNKICAACHQVNGLGSPPVFPAMKGSSIATGKPISRHINTILHGVQGTAMQAFASQLNDLEIAAVVTYERNAFGNDTGDLVQPKAVNELREQ